MLKESETEEARCFCHLFLIGEISIGGGGAGPCFPPGYTYGALAMVARSWLFCYDMLGYYTTKSWLFFYTKYNFLFHTEHGCGRKSKKEAVEAVEFLWKRKHFNERDRKRTQKRLILSGAGSRSKIPKVRKRKRTRKYKTSRGAGSGSIKNLTASTSLVSSWKKLVKNS